MFSYRCTLGGYTSLFLMFAQYSYMLSDVDLGSGFKAYTNYFNASRYPSGCKPNFEECSKVNIHFKSKWRKPRHICCRRR